MTYLSPQIEALAKRKSNNSLVKKEYSCGIFQDYGTDKREQRTEQLKQQGA